MPGLSDVLDPTSSAVQGAISGAGAAGRDTIDAVVDGARSGMGSAFGVGSEISDALLDGLMQPLGASGAAIGDLAQTVAGSVQDIIGAGVQGAGDLLSAGGQLVGTLGGVIGVGVGAAVGLAFGGPLVGAAIGGGVMLVVGSIVGFVGEGLGTVVEVAGDAMGELGEVAGKGFETLITVVEDVFNAAISRARSTGDIAYATGMPFAGANQTAQNFGALGIGGDQLARLLDGPNMNPLLFQSRASAFGLPGIHDPNFQSSLASTYQGFQSMGPEGNILARQMMGQLNMDTPEMRRMASLSPGQIGSEQAFTRDLNEGMGLDPETLRKFSEEFPLLTNRIGQTADAIKIKFIGELMDAGGEEMLQLAATIGNNSEAIVGGLKVAALWIVNDLPVLVLTGLEMVLEGGQLFLTGLSSFSSALADDLRAFENSDGVIYAILNPIAMAIDFVGVGFKGLMMLLAPLGAMVMDFNTVLLSVSNTMLNALKSMVTSDTSPIVMGMRAAGYGDIVDSIRDFQLPTLGNGQLTRTDPRAAMDWASKLSTPDVSGALLNAQNSGQAGQIADQLDKWAPKIQGGADWLGAQKERVGELRDNWPQILAELQRQNDSLDKIADNTGETASNTKVAGDLEGFGRFFTNMTARRLTADLAR